jgi:hypothetical protein
MVGKKELGKLISEGRNIRECCEVLKINSYTLKKLRKQYGFDRKYSRFETSCEFCGKKIAYNGIKEKEIRFCSIKCSNYGRKKSDETKAKISEKMKEYFSIKYPDRPVILDRTCIRCKIDINHKRNKKAKFCSRSCLSKYFNNLPERKQRQSESRTNYLQNNGHVDWFETFNIKNELIKVQGTWENEFAVSLNRLGILYERKQIKFTKTNNYTPDFYLPEYDFYVEIKGFLYEKDKYKMLVAINNTNSDIRIISDIKKIKSITKEELSELAKVKDIIRLEDIDFSKFVKRY